MTRTKLVLGLLCLGALCLAAFGAADAVASGHTLHECVAKGSGGTGFLYTSSTCETESASGTFETKPLPAGESKAAKTTATSNFVISQTVGGVVFTITCTGLEAPGLEETNEEVGGEMMVTGRNGTFKFTGCSVTAPKEKGCEVPATLEMVKLKSTTTASGSTKFEPASGTTFITIGVSGASCPAALKGEKAYTGVLISAQETSATQAFTSTSGSELLFSGQKATFTGKYHLSTPTGERLGLEPASAPAVGEYTLHECVAKSSGGTRVLYTTNCETESASGTFETKPLPAGESKAVKATQTSNFVISATVAGVNFAVTCTGLEAPGQEMTNEPVGSEMFVSGKNGTFGFTGCSVTAPKEEGCTVPSTLETVKLKSKTNASGSATFEPASGGTFTTIPVTKCSIEALNGEKAFTGSLTSVRETASTQAFTTTSGSSVVLGGQAATLTGKYHLSTPTGEILGLETPSAPTPGEYTLHECVAKGSGGTGFLYTSSTCETESASGTFETKPLPAGESKAAKTTATSNFVISQTVGGVVFTITCTGFEQPGLEVTNEEAGEPKEMMVTGRNGTFKFTGCSVTAPKEKGCEVPATLEMVKLKSTTNASGSTRFEPASGTTFITIAVSGASCPAALKGEKAYTGVLISARETSATQAFTSTSGSELLFSGQKATFTGKYHLSTPTGERLGLETP